jgi:chromatin segregation and condensation protein Rec8/ScpA/Scc1 (kleisin family)
MAPQLAALYTRNLTMKFPYLQKAPEKEEEEEEELREEEARAATPARAEYEPAEYEPHLYVSPPRTQEDEELATPAELAAPEEPEIRREGPEYSDRTRKMHNFLQKNFGDRVEELSYLSMVENKKRHVVVGTFFELLVLKSTNVVQVKQDKPYGDIIVSKGKNFNQEVIVAS